MWLIQLGEVIFGGVGSGLYGMLAFAIIAVFMAGLMVGRTPEYLGKKIEAYEMKMASLVILFPPLVVLVGTAIAVVTSGGLVTPSRHADDSQSRAARLQRSAVCLLVGGQQQRQRLRRPQRQRAVLQHGAGHRDVDRPLLAGRADPGHRRLAGGQESHADQRRHAADASAAVRRVVGVRS